MREGSDWGDEGAAQDGVRGRRGTQPPPCMGDMGQEEDVAVFSKECSIFYHYSW